MTSNSALGLTLASFIKMPAIPTAKCLGGTLFIVMCFLKDSALLAGVVEGGVTLYKVATERTKFVCTSVHTIFSSSDGTMCCW